MKSNYNDVIDIILTFIEDEQIMNNVIITGSIVPYLISSKPSHEFHSDLYFLVEEKFLGEIRQKIKKLSKEYLFDIVSDSKKCCNRDFGFKIKYEDTYVGFFPYKFKEQTFVIKTYSIKDKENNIYLKTKTINELTRNLVMRQIPFSSNKILRLISPEYVYIDKKLRERKTHNPTMETMKLLDEICDESVLKVLQESMSKMDIKVKSEKISKNFLKF